MELFSDRHAHQISGVLSCLDRLVITGTIPGICYADGMSGYLRFKGIRIFDYTQWAEPLRNEIREGAQRVAAENGIQIEHIRKPGVRKEERVRRIVERRGEAPGLVHVISAMEACSAYKPWHDKQTHKTSLRGDTGKCLHYYFYFIDDDLGLCYLRVPTWAPFRLQFYCNGHNILANQLRAKKIGFEMLDNAFVHVEDWERAQALADALDVGRLRRKLDHYARRFCPPVRLFPDGYHWSLMQVEYATDLIFKRRQDLAPIYEALVRTAVHAVRAEHVATFLGRKLHGNYRGEAGNDFDTRIQGTRIKHAMGSVAVKMYDKQGRGLRIETVANDVSFFKHHRRVEHRDGSWSMKTAPLKKSIYSLGPLIDLMRASNRRYLEFISAIDVPSDGIDALEKISRPTQDGPRSCRGINLFHGEDLDLFIAIVRGEFNISGLQNKHLRKLLPGKTPHQISRMFRRLRTHGLIKKVAHGYKYYLTALGRRVTATALRLRQMFIIPSLQSQC
jgi:hypothetical protein